MLLLRHRIDLGFEHSQRADQTAAGFMRLDHVVDEAVLGGDERAGEPVIELRDLLLSQFAILRQPVPAGRRY